MNAASRPGVGETRLGGTPGSEASEFGDVAVRRNSGLPVRACALAHPVASFRRSAVSLLALLACAAMLAAAGCGVARPVGDGLPDAEGPGREVVVERVTDGDTVEVRPAPGGVEDVRLIGVDAPESFGSGGPQPYAAEATGFAERALEGRRVTLEFDAERTDQYGRLLAYVYGPDGGMFNESLLVGGYAQVATFPPNTRYEDRFEAAQERAREAGRGIWGLEERELCRLTDRGNGVGGGC